MGTNHEPPTVSGRPSLIATAFGLTDTGRVRPTNEDQFLCAELTKTMRVWQTSLAEPAAQLGEARAHVFLVADGMGGHRAGEQASALAVLAIEQFTLNTFPWFFHVNGGDAQRVLEQFESALRQTDARIVEESTNHPEFSGMGTTVTMAYHLDAQLCILHVGDSRAYLFADAELTQITRDHTLLQQLVERGELPRAQVAHHRLRHVITNVVGGSEAGVDVEAHALAVHAGDRLLLCSDGLTEMLSDDAIGATLRVEPQPEGACTALVAQANAAGGADNITVVIVRFDAADSPA
jgi:serine/threonine protein phosphatase PrpC